MVMPLSIQLSVRAVKKLELYALKGSVSSSAKKKKKRYMYIHMYTPLHQSSAFLSRGKKKSLSTMLHFPL